MHACGARTHPSQIAVRVCLSVPGLSLGARHGSSDFYRTKRAGCLGPHCGWDVEVLCWSNARMQPDVLMSHIRTCASTACQTRLGLETRVWDLGGGGGALWESSCAGKPGVKSTTWQSTASSIRQQLCTELIMRVFPSA